MKILVDSDLIEEYFLNRDNEIFPHAENLWKIISRSSKVNTHITSRCLKKICDPENISSSQNVDILTAQLKSIFTICSSSPRIFKNVRLYDSDIEPAIELECGIEMSIDAIITQKPQKYVRNILKIWSVEEFIQIYKLENSFASSINNLNLLYQQNHQLSLPFAEDKDPAKYMIRNRIPIIKKALAILKTAGFCGLTKQEFAIKLGSSETTTRSVIWDLERFGMALSYRDKVEINPNLLDTGKSDISRYLSIVLKDLAIVQQIYREIERDKAITKWRLQKIIADTYSRSEVTKDKSKRDYRSRIISWLLFAKLLEERGNNTFIIPTDESLLRTIYHDNLQQLDLFEPQFSNIK